MMGAVVICELLDHLGAADVGIKWPNDVHLYGRKVSGVLPEAVWDGGRLSGVVLGIGINVSIDFAGTELAETAISITPALGTAVDRLEALGVVLSRIDVWAAALGSAALFDAWKQRLNTLGRQVRIGAVQGVAEAVDDDGALRVRDTAGVLHRVLAGDIALG
jgi:BirA family biotin operon repressor/biotin-[acetyl-CoA-carboxylase] ligase